MEVSTERVALTKRHPLTISRGTVYGSVNVMVRVDHAGVAGVGEMAPSDVTGDSAEAAEQTIAAWRPDLAGLAPWELDRISDVTGAGRIGSATRAALDLACHDWLGNRIGLPLWQLLGVDRARTPLTSVTIGIDALDVVVPKVREVVGRLHPRVLKVKLGQPAGIDADREMFAGVQAVVNEPMRWRVDANGGWSLDDARTMIPWLAGRGVDMVEQPLAEEADDDMRALHSSVGPQLYADESVRTSADVARLADRVHGVNLKLMKCGGLREALRIIHTARAHGLGVMVGCMGESSLAISAGAQLGGLVDALDLDSHLNLLDDPFDGATYSEGRVVASDRPGLGVRRVEKGPTR